MSQDEEAKKTGRPVGTKNRQTLQSKISEADRDYFGYDSRKFLERALLRASTWEEGLKIARELRALQHASLQAIQTKTDTTHTITLRWSTPDELPSNEKNLIELSVDNYESKLPDESTPDQTNDRQADKKNS
jgi:hypothetical protein